MNSLPFPRRSNQACSLFCAVVTFALFASSSASGQDVRMYGVVKGQAFVQTNTGPAVFEGAALQVFVSPNGDEVVTNAVMRAPGGGATPIQGEGHDSEFVQFFPSTLELDAAYPNGIYTIELGTLHDGNTTNALNLAGDAYLATPHFSNFSAGQAVDPTAPFLLSWDAISGATSNDFLQVEISDCTDERVIGTPSPDEPGALNATRTSFLLPARALRPGQRYEVVLQIGRFVSVNTNSYPGVRGIGGYLTRIRTSLVTTGTQTGCPVGRFELVFGYPNFTFGGSTQGMVNFPQGIPYYFALFNLQDDGNTNFPPYVTFTGPVGSGLNNTTNYNGGFGGSSAWYSSPSINTPPFPPGGVYSVQFGGTNYQFNLLDPNAASQQVLLVPTAIVNGSGLLTELRWIYKDINGTTVGPQPFMAGIEIRIDGQNQRLYEAGNRDARIPAATNAHLLSQPLFWTNVSSIQMLFRDNTGSEYGSFWNNSPAPLQIVTSNLPPAIVNSPYFGALVAFGGIQPHSWSIISGALPPGLGLVSNSGAISGTPTNAGTYNFIARVMDTAANHVERSFFIGVTSSNSQPLQIATPALPDGVLSNAYSFFMAASGGNPPYSWLIQSGNLPPGVALDPDRGEIAGTPTALGNFPFTVRVTDDNAQQSERTYRIHIGADGPDARTYLVAKGRRFLQAGASPPAPAAPGYHFISFIQSETQGRISSATLGLPGGVVRTLTNEFDEFKLQQSFNNQDALDAAFANGTYVFNISTLNDGNQTSSLLLTDNAYPLPPRVANWNAAQAVDSRADFTLNWNPFSGGTSNDFIVVSVMNNEGEEIFSTPGYLEPNFLNGTATSVVLPANTLTPFATNKARLLFAKRTAFDITHYPNVPGLAAYFAETYFPINTLNPAGVLQFSVANYRTDENAGSVEITVNRMGGSEGTVTVDFATGNGSATTSDFVPTAGTLTFEPEVTSQTFTVELVDDTTPEGIEMANLLLSNVTGGAGLGMASATLTIVDDDVPSGPSVRQYLVAKGQSFMQSGAGVPALAMEKPFRFAAFADQAFPGGLVSASLRNPSAVTNELSQEGDNSSFDFEQTFVNKAGLDAAFRGGAYTFLFNTLNDGVITPTITLPADAYPSTPHLANWPAAQAINAFANFRLNWDSFVGGSALDYIEVSIREIEMDEKVFQSPDLGEAGALNGTNTSVLIPGGTFEPGKSYRVELLFANRVTLNTEDYPHAAGIGAYFKETSFTIATGTPPPPQGQIQFASATQSFSETNGTATVALMRAGGSEGAVSVTVSMANGTATAGADYAGSSHAVNFADGETNATFTFEILDDSIYEGPESLKLFLSNPTGGATLAGQTNTLVILIDNELPPTPGSLQFSAAAYTVAESAGLVTVTVTRSGGSLGEVAVDYATAGGSASPDSDYEETTGTLVFPSGVNSRTFTIPIHDDDLDETNEVLEVGLSNPLNGATLGARTTARVIITDNDTAGTISFARATYSVSETNSEAEILVRRSGGLAEGVTVDYTAFSGTATEGDDFEPVSGTLEFEAGEIEKVILVPLFDDALPEGNESLSLLLTGVTGGAVLGAITNATLIIIDDEVVIQFSRVSYTNSEAIPVVTLTVTRTGPATDEVTVDYTTADDTALAGEDYGETNGTIVFAAGIVSRTFTVPILNDTEAEEDETFTVTLGNPGGNAQLGERDTATVLIVDNDEAGVIAFSATNFNVRESAPYALVTVLRTGGRASDVTVDFEVLDGVGTADAESDYVTANGTLNFGAGVTRLTFVVPIRDDATMEGNETLALRLSNPSGGATLGPRSEATVTILDNDVAGAFRFSAIAYRVSETGALATVTVLRSGGKASASVDYATANGTAIDGVDYTATSGTLLFGSNEVARTFTVPILDDALPDGNGTVLLSLSNPDGGARLVAPTNAILTIQDDELGVQFASASYVVVEGVRSIALTVVRAGASATSFTVHYATADGTATAGADYTLKSGTLTFGPTVTSQTIVIPIRNDTEVEEDETFTVTLSSPSGAAQLGARSVATVTIMDNDASLLRARRAR